MISRETTPRGYDELGSSKHEELVFADGEMQLVAEKGISAFEEALKNPDNLITDTVTYRDIPHLDGLRTPAIYLGLQSRKLRSLTIEVPRKKDNIAITISAQDEDNPNRRYVFSEITDDTYGDAGSFIVADTDWLNAEKANRPVDQLMSGFEVANWLYRQAGVSEEDVARKLKTEDDPVQDAAHILSFRAKSIDTQRQVKVPVRENLWFFGEEISALDPEELLVQPNANSGSIPKAYPVRMYNLWTNAVYDTDLYGGVRERLTASFSPDNPFLMIPNPRSSMTLSVDTTKFVPPRQLSGLFTERKLEAEGSMARLFENVAETIAAQNDKAVA